MSAVSKAFYVSLSVAGGVLVAKGRSGQARHSPGPARRTARIG